MERAYDDWKHGRWSDDPFIEMTQSSVWDPTLASPGHYFVSCFIQYCPAEVEGGWTPEKRDAFGKTVIDQICNYSPNFRDHIAHMEIRTPYEIENEIGLTEGNIFQGELTIDQLMFNPPLPWLLAVPRARQGNVHVRLWHAPRRRRFVRLRSQLGPRNSDGPETPQCRTGGRCR